MASKLAGKTSINKKGMEAMKKWCSLLVAAALLIPLSGCGGGGSSVEKKAPAPKPTKEPGAIEGPGENIKPDDSGGPPR